MNCLICESSALAYCRTKVLGKHDVQYFRCSQCQFVFTEVPYWLDEAYSSVITKLDIGLITRNEIAVPIVKTIINRWFNPSGNFIDYGGGYGMLVRMMRDRGFNFYRQDMYCDNLYAESFDVTDIAPFKAELLTAFEVFEHLTNPVAELEKMLAMSDAVLFSTNIQPSDNVTPESWWYFIPETGQHISLYSRKSLQALADRFNLYYNWDEQNFHLYSKKKISNSSFKTMTHPRWGRLYNKLIEKRPSLLDADFTFIQNRLKESLSFSNKKE